MATPISLPPPDTPYWLIAFVLVAFIFPVLGLLSKAFNRLLDFASKVIIRSAAKPPNNVQQINNSQETETHLSAIDRDIVSHDVRINGNGESIRDLNRDLSETKREMNKELHEISMAIIRK